MEDSVKDVRELVVGGIVTADEAMKEKEKEENPCFYHPDQNLPCESCKEGLVPTRVDVSTRDFTVLIRGTIQSEVMDDGGVRKLHMKTMKREIEQSIIFDDRVATFDDVKIVVKPK